MTVAPVLHSSTHLVQDGGGRKIAIIALLTGLLAIGMRWYFVVHAQVLMDLDAEMGWGDAAQFYRYAWHLVHEGIFSSDTVGFAHPRADGFRDPGYPGFMALAMLVTSNYDQWYALLLLTQVALGGLTVVCTVLAMRDVMPAWLLAVGGTVMALWPHLVAIPAYILSENLTAPCFALAAFALGEASRRRSIGFTVVGGISLSIAALSNAVLGPVVVPLIVVFAWKRVLSRRQLAVLLLTAAAPLAAWSVRNASLPTILTPTLRAEVNFVQGSWPTYHAANQLEARRDPVGIETIDAINFEIATLNANRAKGFEMITYRMSQAPWTYVKWYLGKPALTWGWEIALGQGDIYVYPTRNSPFIVNPFFKAVEAVTYICNGIVALLALGGVFLVFRRTPTAAMLTIGVTLAWITLVYWVLQSDARYSIAFRPGEIALACLCVASMVNYLRNRRASQGRHVVSSVTP